MKSSAQASESVVDAALGPSAPAPALYRYFGITAEAVATAARAMLL